MHPKFTTAVFCAGIVFLIHTLYLVFINPEVEALVENARITGDQLPRNIYIILKDFEQELCLILFGCAVILCIQNYIEITSMDYLLDVDLFEEEKLSPERAFEYLSDLEEFDDNTKNSFLVETLSSSLRRFALTKNIESAANAIEPALELLSIKNENNLSVIKYISWAIPSIGFLGTVRGIGQAMSEARAAVEGNIGPMTSSLGLAFNSTFVALIASVVLMMMLTYLQNAQDNQLINIKKYTERYLINRIHHD